MAGHTRQNTLLIEISTEQLTEDVILVISTKLFREML